MSLIMDKIIESNRSYFDNQAISYKDRPGAVALAQRIVSAVRKHYPLNEDETTVLDYACGPGLVSQAFIPYVKKIVGIDISQGMVDLYNRRVDNQGLSPQDMQAKVIDPEGGFSDELQTKPFNFVVCAMSYHHFPSIAKTTQLLFDFLAPNGVLIVVDILNSLDEHIKFDETYDHIVPHGSGFDEATMQSTFEDAGLRNFNFVKIASGKMHGRSVNLFMASGTKPAYMSTPT